MLEDRSVIKRLLDQRGLRYIHFCEALGIAQYTFSRIEGGVQKPPADYYERAARYFDIPNDLFVRMLSGEDSLETQTAEAAR